MRALTWQGRRSVSVETVPDPVIEQPTDALIRVTSTAICGSDLHLYEVLGPFLTSGDVLGHESMGIVEEVGAEAGDLEVGDRVVVPFNISCGHCWMCSRGLFAQCETTQVREFGKGASLFGYTSLYGAVPGAQAEYLRVPQAQFGPVKVPDERFLYLSDILPTAWQAVEYADVPAGGTLAVFGLGPVGQLAARIALRAGYRVIGAVGVPPDVVAVPLSDKLAVDRTAALLSAIKSARRGGTVSVSGVCGGEVDPMPLRAEAMTASRRVVLVTGASSGIGRETALACVQAGAASALVVPLDVNDDAAVAEAVDRAVAVTGSLDLVVSCAGVVAYGRTEEVPAEVFDAVLGTNLIGSVNLARHVVPVLRRQQFGSFVLVGSVTGHIAVPTMSPYVLSKWGVRALARQLDLENRDLRRVRVFCVSPGGVDTPIYRQAATYSGFVGRPPPPVASPERVARRVLRATRHRRSRIQVGVANDVLRVGFAALPWAFDALVGPLFTVGATDRTSEVAATSGNVLASRGAGNAAHGAQGRAVVGIGRNVVAMAGRRVRAGAP